ncbi:MAG: (Fe-S)-binding protein [Desulfurococcales archaeon]|nr:(Fe-S)-binding protein [Desulfurococcales archaeon]
MLDVRSILRILADNIKRTGLPVPGDPGLLTSWSTGLGLSEKGDTILYTGGLYQLLPYIEEFAEYLEKLEGGKAGGLLLKAAGRLGRLASLSKIVVRPSRERLEYSRQVLVSIVELLRRAGVEIAYPGGVDSYSGVLLYDMGLDTVFVEHARRVAQKLESVGAETIVTVDPHTTHVLRKVFPQYVEGFAPIVKSYIEVLAENIDNLQFKQGDAGRVVIHDPCFYARYENIIDEPRELLRRAGYTVVEPRRSGRMTYCCGGPVESIAPRLSRRIAETRARELDEAGGETIVTLCPICYSNLRRAYRGLGIERDIQDLSILLYRRLGP